MFILYAISIVLCIWCLPGVLCGVIAWFYERDHTSWSWDDWLASIVVGCLFGPLLLSALSMHIDNQKSRREREAKQFDHMNKT